MRKKLFTAFIVSFILVFSIVLSVVASSRHNHDHIHDVNCGYDCFHEVISGRIIHLNDEYGLSLFVRTSIEKLVCDDGEYVTILYSTTSYVSDDAIVDNPLSRDGTIAHAIRCGGTISITHNDFHTFNATTGVCMHVTRFTTNTCVRCWASMSFTTVFGGCGRTHF